MGGGASAWFPCRGDRAPRGEPSGDLANVTASSARAAESLTECPRGVAAAGGRERGDGGCDLSPVGVLAPDALAAARAALCCPGTYPPADA